MPIVERVEIEIPDDDGIGAVPSAVTRLQLFDALAAIGLDLDQIVAGLPDRERRRFELAVEIGRNDPMIEAAASGLGWTDAQVDDLFRAVAAG